MTYTAPTPDEFKTRFPSFADVDSGLVQLILDEAGAEVGTSWLEADRKSGVLHLTAHLLVSQGLDSDGPGGGAAVTGAIKKRSVGDVQVEFAGIGTSVRDTGALSGYRTTAYGRRYLELMRRNFPAVEVV